MPVLYALEDIATLPPRQVGETARWLFRLQQAGYAVPLSWVLSGECFERSLKTMVAREPAFADWPQLLWQSTVTNGYPRQHFAQRLRRPLQGLSLGISFEPFLATLSSPVVRLLPSLWFGTKHATAAFAQMMTPPLCWAEPTALESAIKQLWSEILTARSLAYWEQWSGLSGNTPKDYPEFIGVAILMQTVEPTILSGTLTIHPDHMALEAVQGLPHALTESYADYYHGSLSASPPLTWQIGYQEQSYQPADTDLAAAGLENCLTTAVTPQTAVDVLSSEAEMGLLQLAQQLQQEDSAASLRVEWLLPMGQSSTITIAQAFPWPLKPATYQTFAEPLETFHELSGRPAAPGQALGKALVIQPHTSLPASAQHQIIVAEEVFPNWLPLLKTAAAVISEKGGLTCHAAILARELRLPAVVGVTKATTLLKTGDVLRLDGDRGLIESLALETVPEPSLSLPALPAQFNCRTDIWLNLSQPDVAAMMASLPVAGIGLLRSEWLMMPVLDGRHPNHWLQQGQGDILRERLMTQLRPILRAFFPRPVRYRSLDICTNEYVHLAGAPPVEANPMLGMRGVSSYQQQPEFFQLELAVLRQLQLEGCHNLQLILPFVRTVEEVLFCQQLIQAMGLNQNATFELWMMAEVPSVLFQMPQYVEAGVQGIAIGTNDLTQLLLGIDRNQLLPSTYLDERHPAVQAAIAQLIQQAHALQIPCTVCGVAPARYPDLVTSLVQQGITGISVDAAAVGATVQTIQAAEALLSS
ncbi:MAG: putative PEP-binding protein [Cyanobacteria bacterium P01_H01_bin.58]